MTNFIMATPRFEDDDRIAWAMRHIALQYGETHAPKARLCQPCRLTPGL
ncbi:MULTISPECIES: hypothetical protein [Methylosinus]|nr:MULTISPECIES: hypothetical protein [Methylosinus]MBU3889413.1 hypothetical protein [Methylosinus sp. KRF6]